jgi:hypothetical protein
VITHSQQMNGRRNEIIEKKRNTYKCENKQNRWK